MKKLFLSLMFLTVPALAGFVVPELKHPVNDYANVLTTGGKERIAKAVVELKAETGAQVGVLIVDTLDGTSIEQASLKAAETWGLGSKKRADGALLLIAVKDRKIRLEVGRGLEGILTDYKSKAVTSSMKDYLRKGDYDAGILAAIGSLSTQIKAGVNDIPTNPNVTDTPTEGGADYTIFFILLGLLGIGGATGLIVVQTRKELALQKEARRIGRRPLTPDQRKLAGHMYQDLKTQVKNHPQKDIPKTRESDDSGFTTGLIAGSLLSGSSRSSSDDSSSSSSDSSSSDSGSSYSSSDYSGGGGDFSGGGSSDSF